MANFNSMVLTEKGQILYAKGQAGATINFTKLAVGIGSISSIDPTTLTDLVNRKFDIGIQGKSVNTLEKVALISGTLTNTDMRESVYLQEIGLYALDPDDGEILYSYASAGNKGDYTSPASNGPYSWNYQVYAAIGNAANVTVTLSNLQYDTSVINSNTTLSIIKGSNQKDLNQSIDNKFKIYTTTNSENVYTVTSSDIDTLEDGYPIRLRFNADSTGDTTLIVNDSTAMALVDYFGNKVSNIRKGLIANIIYDASNSNFQLLGKGGEGDATPEQVLSGKKVTVNSGPITGTMHNNNVPSTNLDINGSYTIPQGYHPGTEKVTQSIPTKSAATYTPSTSVQTIAAGQYISEVQTIAGDANLLAANIVSGISMFGLVGTATKVQSTLGYIDASTDSSGNLYLNLTPYLSFTPNFLVINVVKNNTTGATYNCPNIYSTLGGINIGFRYDYVGGTSSDATSAYTNHGFPNLSAIPISDSVHYGTSYYHWLPSSNSFQILYIAYNIG